MTIIKIGTWNVRGIHTPSRRYLIYSYLKRHHIQIALLQETHLPKPEIALLQRRWRCQIYATGYSAFARGVLIWVRPGVPFEIQDTVIDAEGRYVIVRGMLDGRQVVMASLYAPNTEQGVYLDSLSCVLAPWHGIPLILGGDYNSVLDVSLDRSFPPLPGRNMYTAMKALINWATQWRLTDIWRHRNPVDNHYSYYSGAHDLHVCLDRYMVLDDLLPNVSTAYYLGRTHSDHNPYVLQQEWEHVRSPIPLWRLQPDTLLDAPFRNLLATTIAQYFDENTGTASTPQMERDAFKVVIRGHCLGTQAGMHTQLKKDLITVERRLEARVREAVESTTERLTREQEEHSSLMERLRCLNYAVHSARTHHTGDKADRLLSWLMRQDTVTAPITSIRTPWDTVVHTQREIHAEFVTHYARLYKSQLHTAYADIQSYLDDLELPQLTSEQKVDLNVPILPEEVREGIFSLANGKSPGPDGLPAEFYKANSQVLIPQLLSA